MITTHPFQHLPTLGDPFSHIRFFAMCIYWPSRNTVGLAGTCRSYHRSGVCRPCRTALQSRTPHHLRMWQCGRLSDYGVYFVELWLQICQPMNCMRFQNLAELENARMFASRRMEPPDAFRLSVFELARRRFNYPDAAWPSVACQKNPCVCFYWRRMGKDVCVCIDRTWPLACRPHYVWASSTGKKVFAVFDFLWVLDCHETLE